MLTASQHRAEAEKLLSAASWTKGPDDFTPSGFVSVEVASLLAARANAHALLATGASDEDRARFEAMRRVVAGHLCEGLTHPSSEVREFLHGLADELDRAGVGVSDAVEQISARTGRGPYRYRLDSIDGSADQVVDLTHQWVDRNGTVWEHMGNWARFGTPVMGTPDDQPRETLPLTALVSTRGPLRSRKDGTTVTSSWAGGGGGFDAATRTWTDGSGKAWDLAAAWLGSDGRRWEWKGAFDDSGEPLLVGESDAYTLSSLDLEFLGGPLVKAEEVSS